MPGDKKTIPLDLTMLSKDSFLALEKFWKGKGRTEIPFSNYTQRIKIPLKDGRTVMPFSRNMTRAVLRHLGLKKGPEASIMRQLWPKLIKDPTSISKDDLKGVLQRDVDIGKTVNPVKTERGFPLKKLPRKIKNEVLNRIIRDMEKFAEFRSHEHGPEIRDHLIAELSDAIERSKGLLKAKKESIQKQTTVEGGKIRLISELVAEKVGQLILLYEAGFFEFRDK